MNENPYQTPENNPEPPASQDTRSLHEEKTTPNIDETDKGPHLHPPQVVSTGRGAAWFSEGWKLFMRSPVLLTVMGILSTLLFWVVNLVPLIGNIAAMLFLPHIGAGFYLAYQHAYDDQPVNIGDLFEPFKEMQGLLVLGSLYLAGSIVITIVMMVFTFGGLVSSGMLEAYSGGEMNPAALATNMLGINFLLGLLIVLALSVILAMAFLFAPILVHQHRMPALEAVKQSFSACWRNYMPFLIWGLIWLGLILAIGLLSLIPILGWLLLAAFIVVMTPLSIGNLYLAYRDIFLR